MSDLMSQFDVVLPGRPEPERVYVGKRVSHPSTLSAHGEAMVVVVQGDIERRLDAVGRHSPDGFEWGYGGSGPSELALSILADHLECEPPPALYQAFKAAVVANLPHHGWQLRASEIASWLARNMRGSRG